MYNQSLMFTRLRHLFFLATMLISLSLLVWSYVPGKHQTATIILSPEEMQLPGGSLGSLPSSLGERKVGLEWPTSLRIGEEGWIKLTFDDYKGSGTTSTRPGDYTDIYRTHNVVAEARFEIAGVKADPANPVMESMPPGQQVSFRWQIRADKQGWYDGTVWLTLRFLPLAGNLVIHKPVYIREIKLHANSIVGLSIFEARLGAGVGLATSFALGYKDLPTWIFSRMGKKIASQAEPKEKGSAG